MSNEYELTHWGIKGQRWGVRRTKAQLARARGSSKKSKSEDEHEDYKKAHSSKSVKSMSDKELRERNNRLQAEKQYKSLTAKKSKAKQIADTFVATATTVAAVAGAAAVYKKYGTAALSKIRDMKINSSQEKWLL